MRVLERPWGRMHYEADGGDGPLVAFSNSLGTDLRLWDALLPLLPAGLRHLRYDKRGHGLSDMGGGHTIADLADDAAALIEAEGGPCVFVGLSIGGLIGQDLATRRPDLLRALVLVSTAARIGTDEVWEQRIDAVTRGGTAAIAEGAMERWFSPAFRGTPALAPWRNMLLRTPAEGWAASARAIKAADFAAALPRVGLPTLVIAGEADGSTPPALVEATARLVPGAAFHVIPGSGHLPPVEAPEALAALLAPFLREHARG